MVPLIGIHLHIQLFHGRLIILNFTYLSGLLFCPYFRHWKFTSIITNVGELISFGQTVEVTICENGLLFLPLFEPQSSEHSHER